MIDSNEEIQNESYKEKYDELLKKYTYAIADFENYKKRNTKEKESNYTYGVTNTILLILPVLDDFERAFNHNELAEGGKLIYKKMLNTLESIGLSKIDTSNNVDFNTDEHEAISVVGENNKVVEELLTGYKLNGKVIRYAKVVVG